MGQQGAPAQSERNGASAPEERAGPTDEELVGRATHGDPQAFEMLIQRYQSLVCVVAYRQLHSPDLVEDVAQETFVRAFLHLGELDDVHRFKSWLLRIAANLSLDFLRRRKKQGVSLDETGAYIAAEAAAAKNPKAEAQEADRHAVSDEVRVQIVEAIYSLPEEYQMPAAMKYLEEIPYKEIARRLGLREEAVRKRIHRANQMLRRKLQKVWPGGASGNVG
jgi:RNA polymerase sigma-70 factor (ECF subfamily)